VGKLRLWAILEAALGDREASSAMPCYYLLLLMKCSRCIGGLERCTLGVYAGKARAPF
jgi:hypothetical protein